MDGVKKSITGVRSSAAPAIGSLRFEEFRCSALI
jgi:hypothetical protein